MTSGLRTAFIYSPRFLEFDYGPGHPLRNERLGLAFDLINACELVSLPSTRAVEPGPATDNERLVFLKPDDLHDCELPARLPASFLARHKAIEWNDTAFIDASCSEGTAKACAWEEVRGRRWDFSGGWCFYDTVSDMGPFEGEPMI